MTLRCALCILACLTLLSASRADDASLVTIWNFGTEEATPLNMHGNVLRDQAGPRSPEFPDFAEDNTAVRFDASGYFSVADPGAASEFDFTNGDAITLEAWVRIDKADEGKQMYVVGKGRTGSPKFARDNQNWALRVVSAKGTVKISFLFATELNAQNSHWHRWISEAGFLPSSGWHHIAAAYHFGEPDSIRGWIDGKPTAGAWDMGGPTRLPPVVDDDEVWIGSSSGGHGANSFRGWIDAVAIHRAALDDKAVAAKFNRVGGPRVMEPQPEVMPELDAIPDGRVLVTFAEGFPSDGRWPFDGESWPSESGRWLGDEFLLSRIPVRYEDWGIRTAWNAPVLVRLAGDVDLLPGKYRFLVRTRSLSRLWIDGKLVARTPPNRRRGGNLEPIVPVPQPPFPGARVLRFAEQETFGDFEVSATENEQPRRVRAVLELIVGGKDCRTETGEVCVAVQSAGDDWFNVLRPDATSPLPLVDDAIETALAKIDRALTVYDDETRRAAAASQDDFWSQRHDFARRSAQTQNVANHDTTDENPVDALVADKIARAVAESAAFDERTTRHFHGTVLPILREQCFRCHGEKDQGGLRLDTRERALRSGESELPAIVPGDPDASEMIVRIRDGDMPPTDDGLSDEQVAVLEQWVSRGAAWPAPPITAEQVAQAPIVDDASFLRRVYLDTIGVPPSRDEAVAFLSSHQPNKRERLVDQLLDDPRYAGHWIHFWLDLLAENPTLLNASLNSTGPFRWFLYDSLRDGKPMDRMVTELILMRGTAAEGGSAGFALAGENDSPMAAKAHILASAFLGIELQCARCHDSPYHSTTQEDLYSLAAMLSRKPLAPPKTSRVPDAFFENKGRESLIRVSLPLGKQVSPKWPFAAFTGIQDSPELDVLMQRPDDARERLAALITAPNNQRFPQVMVNHLWKQLIGTGIVEPVDDWEGKTASHPELLDWLARQLITHNYDQRHVMRLIMNSQIYQRQAIGNNRLAVAPQRFFNAPDARRLTAEQIVDSLFAATGRSMDVEELTFNHDGSQSLDKRLSLGTPSRAWMFASLNNERDRPSLSLPRAQPIVDVLEAFGWIGSRQKPIAERETDPNVLQPGILANGTLSMSLTRAAYRSTLADLAVNATSADGLLNDLFLRFLAREPDQKEQATLGQALSQGFDQRLVPADQIEIPAADSPLPRVTWTNHLVPEANEIQLEVQRRVLKGPSPDPRLASRWREVYEDVVWSLVNHNEFVWMP